MPVALADLATSLLKIQHDFSAIGFASRFLLLNLVTDPLWRLVGKLLPTLVLSMAFCVGKVALLVSLPHTLKG